MGKNFKQIDPKDVKHQLSGTELVELKVDGTMMTWDGTEFLSNRGVERSSRFPHVITELKQIDALVEGEIAIPGSHVLHLNKRENWGKAKFYLFGVHEIKGKDVRDADPLEARKLIDNLLKPYDKDNLRSCRRFDSFKKGWAYVEREIRKGRYAEGLVVKGAAKTWKIKKLQEMKVPIVSFQPGSVKGAFQLQMPNGEIGSVSGTSVAYVDKYNQLLADNEKPYAEIEYQFLTDRGVPFQPRLRQLDTLANIKAA